MTTPFQFPNTVEPGVAKQTLAMLIEQAFESVASGTRRRALRVEVPVEGVEPLAWLEAQGDRSRGYWCDRDRGFELAGVGTADILSAEVECDYGELFTTLKQGISSVHPNLRYYGGMRFSQRTPAAAKWKPFGAYRFVLPRFEVFTRGAQTYLACNAILADQAGDLPGKILEALDAMPFPGIETPADLPPMLGRHDCPDSRGWGEAIRSALDLFGRTALEKVVLARESVFTFEHNLDAAALLRRLFDASRQSYRFCFQPKPGAAFLGVSPERLYQRQDRLLRSEAVAGTRKRGDTDDADRALSDGLLSSEKDLREHRYVLDAIRAEFGRRCTAVHADDSVSLIKLSECQHLCARVEGILQDNVTDADLLRSLHPTPAVGGWPRELAAEAIAQTEHFDRGWYSGPVGWVGSDSAEFAVGIRSALVHEDTLSVYAGAGIVEGSTPEDEWAEIENKIGSFTGILGTA